MMDQDFAASLLISITEAVVFAKFAMMTLLPNNRML